MLNNVHVKMSLLAVDILALYGACFTYRKEFRKRLGGFAARLMVFTNITIVIALICDIMEGRPAGWLDVWCLFLLVEHALLAYWDRKNNKGYLP